jgi:hypothetical protein
MADSDFISLFIIPLNRIGIEYMVTGSVAAMLYGEPRMTHDIDLVVTMRTEQIAAFIQAFPERGYYCPPEEVIGTEIARAQRGHFNLIHRVTGYKADIYLFGNDELHAWGMKNRKGVIIENNRIDIAPVEYVIVRKLEYFRESGYQKHLLDIEGILRVEGTELSLIVIQEWIKRFSLDKEWSMVKKIG